MLGFLKCVAEAAVENGLQGLLALVPGGPYAYAVGGAALKKYRERKKEAEQRAEIVQLAQATFEQARVEAVEAVRQVLAEKHVNPPPEEVVGLELWLASVPEATRVSLKRKDDPSGRSIPDGFRLRDADDVVKLLPPRPPKFTPGAALPGKSGWVLDRLLGVGGFGEVWFARNSKLTSLTGAVKFCHGEQARDLQHEAGVIDRLMATGRHPNIVPLTDVNLEGDTPWLMYEYVAGGTLADWVHTLQGMKPDQRQAEILAALKQLVDAVGYFHKLDPPIVHRDLKPANILLNKASKKLQITDFGIGAVTAKATLVAESRGQSTHAGRLLTYMRGSHTPLYASPQQKVGADPDPRDDVHALGVIAYQLFIGNLATGPGRDMDDDLRDNGASEGLIELLGKSVAQKADRRPKDAGEMGVRLEALARAESVSPTASVASPPVVTPKPPEVVRPPAPAVPPLPQKDWHLLHEGEQTGPMTFDELRQAAAAGKIVRDTDHVWQVGTPAWVQASAVPALFPTVFDVILEGGFDPSKKIAIIKVVREMTGQGLAEAKATVETTPKIIKESVDKATADEAKRMLEAAGGRVAVRPRWVQASAVPALVGTEFNVILEGFHPAKKIAIIKVVREMTGQGLAEAKATVETTPKIIKQRVGKVTADDAKRMLEAAGGRVTIKPAPA